MCGSDQARASVPTSLENALILLKIAVLTLTRPNVETFIQVVLGIILVPITTITSREFNQDTGRAKKAAAKGPVFITDRGKPAHVLLSIETYQRLTRGRRNIVDALSMPGLADIQVEFPHSNEPPRSADFS
jgi:prevent-host-death family protein